MTLPASLFWSLVRAMALLILFGPLVPMLAAWVRGRPVRWALLAAPFAFPELLVGYAYAPWVAGRGWIAELACALLLGFRTLPVAVVAWALSPPSDVTRSALHCRRLALRTWFDRWDYVRLWMAGPLRRALPSAGLFLLVTFQEFELAALLQATSWTDWLFVAQVQGMTLAESLSAAMSPAAIEFVGIAVVLGLVGTPPSHGLLIDEERPAEPGVSTIAIVFLATAWVLGIAAPMAQLIAGLPAGLWQMAGQPLRWWGLFRELMAGLSASVCAAVIAWGLSGWYFALMNSFTARPPATRRGLRRGTASALVLLCTPGLLGSLILALCVLAVFQHDALAPWYDTPLPWLVGLTLFLAPRAVLLQVWTSASPQSSLHLAELLQRSLDRAQRHAGAQLLWELHGEPRFLAVAMLTYWGYLELTLADLLAPTGVTSGVVRLYNFMHFGRTSALSAEAAVLLLVPLLGMWCLWMLLRWRPMRTPSSGASAR